MEMACAVFEYFYTNRKCISDLMGHCFDILEESVREQTSTDLKILTMQMFESGIR